MSILNHGLVRFLLFIWGYLMFLAFGAWIFSSIESPEEKQKIQELRNLRANFMKTFDCVRDQALEELIGEVVAASNRGVSATKNATGESNWSFGQSFFFTSTVVTTIGYGHVTPLSKAGKIFCIVYAVIGIPLTLVLLSALVTRILVPTIWLLQWLNSRLGHLYQPFNIRLLHLSVMVIILIVVFLLLPAAVFARIEPNWDYMDSLYYCFISLTTIGLGDYIPGDSPNQPYRPLYKIGTTVFLYLGITYLMVTLAVFYDIPQLNLGFLFTSNSENSEKKPLAGSGMNMQYGGASSNVLPDPNEGSHRQVVRVRSRRADSPSPDEPVPNRDSIMP
ncbi:potassium channel subfamily K member 1-like isoform X2 [Harmonia axyridis]|uniref:potassium channel subfamily K member 1-like isoform X2 n=1 Tax=Harmonia axyridis TaxID=115357 RepID=UPI001E277C8E|nr:potassium channel subfamily K member 1-like isoform X2 [Harmonia axyridis]XP_045480566.1 potassium channel subfamily K member 1-like isoform X2 [Harmonia axyridis]XP_045480574.1 potassium channel subfamily K member 1-like isoform X2 [Harmonia axyridis]XP_045480583.1 potassium channel subfamily K member 1-like isoform X2 [Harmonia axyridis]